jgi:hypothetical protein
MKAPSGRRERVLLYGRSGSGKSSAWLSLASWAEDTDTALTIHLGDTDHAYDAVADIPEISSHVSCTDLDVNEYPQWLEWAKETRVKVSRDDWVVVDMIDKAWLGAQTHFWYQMSNGDPLADVYLRNQKAIDSKGEDGEYMGGSHGANWGIINKYYGAFFQQVVSMPCHVMCIAPAAQIRDDSKPEEKNQWKIGWKPQGQKDLPHGFHTVLFAAETADRGWVYTSIRERGPIGRVGRRMLKGERVEDFVVTYLMGVAGWRP